MSTQGTVVPLDEGKAEVSSERGRTRRSMSCSPPLLLFSTCNLHVGCDGWSLWYFSRPSTIVIGRLGKK